MWILTSANCVVHSTNIIVKFGSIRIEYSPNQIHTNTYILHPQFNYYEKDIALVKITSKIRYFGNVKRISLPTRLLTRRYIINRIGSICGFGRIRQDLAQGPQKVLKYENMKIIPSRICKIMYLNVPVDTICAVPLNRIQGPCFGDGGGGLVILLRRTFYILGVLSYQGLNCTGRPSGYQPIEGNLNWIYKVTGIKV